MSRHEMKNENTNRENEKSEKAKESFPHKKSPQTER